MKIKEKKVYKWLPHIFSMLALVISVVVLISDRIDVKKSRRQEILDLVADIQSDLNIVTTGENLYFQPRPSRSEGPKERSDRLNRVSNNIIKLESLGADMDGVSGLKIMYFLELGDFAKSFELLKRRASDEDEVQTLSNFALVMAANGKISEAEEFLKKAINDPRSDWRAWLAYGVYLHEIHHNSDSIRVLTDAMALYPNIIELENLFAHVLIDSGEPEKAIRLLSDVVNSGLADSVTYFLLGSAFRQKQMYDEAAMFVKKACALKPEDNLYRVYLYLLYGEAGEVELSGVQKKELFYRNIMVSDKWDARRIAHEVSWYGFIENKAKWFRPMEPVLEID